MMFSVILPLFNKAPYVPKAIKSVLSQTCSDFELVIMDDGSSDDSYEVAVANIDGDERCHIFRQSNAGVSTARNMAVEFSHGDYLCFLDADDWWEPTFLESVSALISEFPDAGIYGTCYTIVNETKHKTRVASIGVEPGFERGYINYCRVYSKGMYMPLCVGSVCVPRAVFNEMGGFNRLLKLGEDFDLWIKIALKYKVVFLNIPLFNYNQDSAPKWRAVGRLHEPRSHMLWNLDYLADEEKENPDFKHLMDNLRTFSLLQYYISKRYREDAKRELEKVDWSRQPVKTVKLYKRPVVFLRVRMFILRQGSRVKQWILRHL
jgi:glycosyltransferase involved in cell wall biosynthesis